MVRSSLQVKRELAECLRADGFKNVGEAVGCDNKPSAEENIASGILWTFKSYFV